MARFTASLAHVDRVEILPFHKMGESKYQDVGMPYVLADTPSPTDDEVARARAIFARHGLAAI